MFGILNGLQAAAGLAGLLNRPKDPYAKAKAQYMNQYNNRQNLLWQRAMSYNPAEQDASAVRRAQDTTAHALQNAMLGLNQRFKSQGGSPTGDTNFSVMGQRATDDILNPLGSWLADRAASQFDRKQAALSAALGAPPGQMMDAYDAMRSNPSQFGASQEMLMNALTGVMRPTAPKSQNPAFSMLPRRY